MAEEKIGEVVKYFSKANVAAIKVVAGELKIGDVVRFVGHTTDFEETIESMEMDNSKVDKVPAGSMVGIKVKDRVREGDEIVKVI
jgi:putative protease